MVGWPQDGTNAKSEPHDSNHTSMEPWLLKCHAWLNCTRFTLNACPSNISISWNLCARTGPNAFLLIRFPLIFTSVTVDSYVYGFSSVSMVRVRVGARVRTVIMMIRCENHISVGHPCTWCGDRPSQSSCGSACVLDLLTQTKRVQGSYTGIAHSCPGTSVKLAPTVCGCGLYEHWP